MKDYNHAFKHAVQIKNFDDVENLFNEVLSSNGLSDEGVQQAQSQWGARAAAARNAADKGGRKI